MLRRRSAIALPRDAASRFLPCIVALMVFVAALALAAAMLLSDAIARWDRGLSGSLTVQVPPAADERATDARLARIVQMLEATPGIVAARPLSREQLAALVDPWLGSAAVEDLPMPRLIDVRIRPGAAIDIAPLAARLGTVARGVSVDDHQIWLDRLLGYARAMEATALGAGALIGIIAVVTVVFVTLTRMSIHRAVIDLLHLMGASDDYIARQFQGLALRWGFGGGLLGLLPAAAALLAMNEAAGGLSAMIPVPRLGPEHWAAILALPFATGLVAMLTARLTVLVRLKRMP